MSLATRCPTCGTVFRVVQDQLKVSQGWVRCGQCQEVFNALEGLFELTEAPSPVPAPHTVSPASGFDPTEPASLQGELEGSTASAVEPAAESEALPMRWHDHPSPAPAPAFEPPTAAVAAAEADDAADPAPTWPAPPASQAASPVASPAPSVVEVSAHEEAPDDDRFATAAPAVAARPTQEFVVSRVLEMDTDAFAASFDAADHSDIRPTELADGALLAAPPPPTPRFVREAERQARWQAPWVRGMLMLSCGLLSLGLMGQMSLHWRDLLAQRWPVLQPALAALCEPLGCQLDSPMALEHVVLEASHLAQSGQPGVLQVSADLHNTAGFQVRTPALELSFTSDSGQVLVRRVLTPAELGQGQRALAADAAWHVDTRIEVGELPVAGYTLEVFYP